MFKVRNSLKTKLTFIFSVVIITGVFLSAIVGIRLIANTIIRQAQDKVRLDLNTAREIYRHECENIENIVRLTAQRYIIIDEILQHNQRKLREELQKIRDNESLDIYTLTDEKGKVFVRSRNFAVFGDQSQDEIVNWVLLHKQAVVSTQIISENELKKEGNDLAEQARIKLIPTPKTRIRSETVETSGMMMEAAAPVFSYKGDLIGVLYGGKLLNRSYKIVDKVKDIVYRDELYKGKEIGTTTIFQNDLRISTNVLGIDGARAIGTRVSEEVYNQVIGKGVPWIGRAFVVNAWYRAAYEPIRNINGEIIGMLYVGMLEAPYVDLRDRVIFTFLGIAFITVILLSISTNITVNKIVKPIKELVFGTTKIAQGDLSYRVKIKSNDEIGQLAESFNQMTIELQKATEGYLALTRTLEEKAKEKTEELKVAQDHLIQSEKLTALGKLAAAIAHEVNNPLTSILINSHLIAESLKGTDRFNENLELIMDETSRCSAIVRGLLEFARQSLPEKILADVNEVIEKTLVLFESQALFHNVKIIKNLEMNIPEIMIDTNKIKQVFINIIFNALEAMPEGGELLITSKIMADDQVIEIKFKDSGCGIPKENISRVFDPFFTTRGMKGTGLGLSISYGIIQQHNGTIEVQSELGKGTTIIIRLPYKIKNHE